MPGTTRSRGPRGDGIPWRIGTAGDEPVTKTVVNDSGAPITVRPLDAAALPQRERARADVRARGDGRRARGAGEGNAVEERLRHFTFQRAYPEIAMNDRAPLKAYLQSISLQHTAQAKAPASLMASFGQWQLLGPGDFAGRVNSIVVDRNNRNRILIATSSGGVWRTGDGGTTWTDVSATLGTNINGILAIDPGNSNVVYCATGDNQYGFGSVGLFKSTNAGGTWSLTGLTSFAYAHAVIVHPTTSNTVYVATNNGLYRSTDGGATWTQQLTGNITDLVINPGNPSVLFGARAGDGVYQTTNGGTSWTLQSGKPAVGFGRTRLGICNSSPSTVYASFDVAGSIELWKTTNGGTTWTKLSNAPQAGWGYQWYNHYLSVNPNNANIVYSGQGVIFRSLTGGVGASPWTDVSAAGGTGFVTIHVDHHAMAFDPVDPNIIYCGCDGGIYRSRVGGNSWEYIGAAIPTSEFYAIGQGVQEHYEIGGGAQDNGTWITDGAYALWRFIYGGDGFEFEVDPTNPNTVYAESQNLGVGRSDNKGVNFAGKTNGIMEADPKPWQGVIEIDPNNASRIYVGTDRVYRSTNRMDTWSILSCGDNVVLISLVKGASSRVQIDPTSTASTVLGLSGTAQGTDNPPGTPATFARLLSFNRGPFALTNGMTLKVRVDGGALQTVTFNTASFVNIGAASAREVAAVIDAQTNNLHVNPSASDLISAIKVAPSNSNVIYAAAVAQIWRSTDGGATWSAIAKPPLPNRYITDIDVSGTDANIVWVTVSSTGTPHVFQSINGGGTWVARSTGLVDTPANTICIDPTDNTRLWVGTDDGAYITTNTGGSWVRYSEGIPRVHVTDLKLHRNTGLLRAGTYGRGIWERQAADVSLLINNARTANQSAGNVDSFALTQDALALVMDVTASKYLVALGLQYDSIWQIVSAATNKVVRQVINPNQLFNLGQWFWISMGNNWGPTAADYTTPQKWGLTPGIYYFRGAIAVQNTNAFAISTRKWFRVV